MSQRETIKRNKQTWRLYENMSLKCSECHDGCVLLHDGICEQCIFRNIYAQKRVISHHMELTEKDLSFFDKKEK